MGARSRSRARRNRPRAGPVSCFQCSEGSPAGRACCGPVSGISARICSMARASSPFRMVMAVAASAAVSAALAGGERRGGSRITGGCSRHCRQAASACSPCSKKRVAGAVRSTQEATIPRSPSARAARSPSGSWAAWLSRLSVQCWAASSGLPGTSICVPISRRSAPQHLPRATGLGQLPGGLSPAGPVRTRGTRPHAGQVSRSSTRWAVNDQASSHRPSRPARQDGQYRDPRQRTTPAGR